ncbi:hypothetical protein J5N97_006309 [Dioscorea zingiberensis]|uniref:DUF4283 domain-containing protein n=1 Tax=Dioscorea zingiberensis TaxID=325984 RepID=A0A9D5DBM9_9LILI|nr:hypothetical protein J5N97_006309 [Dioscorea zingiberensis]
MSGGGGAPPPVPPVPLAPSWAEVADAGNCGPSSPLPIDKEVLEKLKRVVIDTVHVDEESKQRARSRFQNALYGKLFGKAPPFGIVRTTLLGMWRELGTVHISDMPNGFLLIRCESEAVKDRLLSGGPWALFGASLQLAPWQPCFEPAFMHLTKALVWVQLHNFPVDFWDEASLRNHTVAIGKLVKVDEFTISLSRTKFARVCLEIDLAAPLKRGFWLEDGARRLFVMVLYERAPTFCHSCGVVGHEANTCSSRRGHPSLQPTVAGLADGVDAQAPLDLAHQGSSKSGPPRVDGQSSHGSPAVAEHADDPGFGMARLPRRRGPSRGRGGARGVAPRELHAPAVRDGQLAGNADTRHVAGENREMATHGRGESSNPLNTIPCLRPICSIPDPSSQVAVQIDSCASPICSIPDPRSQVAVQLDRSAGRVKDSSVKGKRKVCSSPPLLLMSSVDQRAASPSDDHRMVVDRVKQALQSNMVSPDPRSDSEFSEDALEMEVLDDDFTLWEIQKGARKGARSRIEIPILGAIQKKKGKRKTGTRGV